MSDMVNLIVRPHVDVSQVRHASFENQVSLSKVRNKNERLTYLEKVLFTKLKTPPVQTGIETCSSLEMQEKSGLFIVH